MIGLHLLLLVISWGFFRIAESVFPRADPSLDLSSYWFTYLIFRPGPFLVSGFFFFSSIWICWYIIRYHAQFVTKLRLFFRPNTMLRMLLFFGGLFIIGMELKRYPAPTSALLGLLIIFDGIVYYRQMRRIKRLKTAFRQFVPK